MSMRTVRRLAADILKCGESRIWIDPDRLEDAKSALTRDDVKVLILQGVIKAKKARGVSRYRGRLNDERRRKGRRGPGSIKGKQSDRKRLWTVHIRAQRRYLRQIKSALKPSAYRMLYLKIKGGEFKSRSQLMHYIRENDLLNSERV